MKTYKYILFSLLMLISLATQAQTILRVDQGATGANNGTSWANAYKDLQTAIDAAAISTPAQVWVKFGTYYPTITTDRNISFIMKNDVEIYGGFKGIEIVVGDRDWVAHETILSGDIGVLGTDTDNSHNVISNSYLAVSPLTNSAILDGVIVERGYNQDNSPARIGGAGLRNENASPIIRNCTFRNNQLIIGGWGGGMLNTGESHPFIVGCKFIDNSSASWGGAIAYRDQGSGIHNVEAVISNCLFYNNHANSVGAAIYVGAYYVNIINNTIANNTSTQTGVGIFYFSFSTITTATYTNNIIWGNTTTSTATVDIQLRLGTLNRPIVSRSLVEDGYAGSVIFNTDPLFYDAPNGDFSIKNCNSPAINVGVNASLPSGISTDLAQSPRIFDTTIDLGAYEYQYLPMSFSAIELGHVSCNGDSDGQISVNVGGGASPLTYNVDGGSFGTNPILTGLAAGNHIVIAKDAFGCEITTTETITEPAALTIAVTSTNLTCNSNNDGSANVTISGGSTPYKLYLDGSFIENLTGSTYLQDEHDAGIYTYGIVDANGCIIAASPITITEPSALTASLVKNNDITCNGADDGSVSITANGGTAPYTYSLDGTNFQSSNVFENLGGGPYTAQVRDANYVALASGCNATTGNVTIIEPVALNTSVAKVDLVCAGSQLGEIVVTATGGTAPLAYSIDGTNFQSSGTFSALNGGAYTITTKDANGCTVTDNAALTEPAAFSSGIQLASITCNGDNDGSITLSPTGGTSPYEYSIDGTNFSSSSSFTNLSGGDYTATIRDTNNCEYTEQVTIINPDVLTVAATFDGAGISLAATGGTTPYNYSVDGTAFQTSNTFVLGNGQYTFTVKDNNNCEATTSQSLVITALNKLPNREQVSIYPNPVTSELYFKSLGVGDKISIFDQSGRTVYTHKADNLTSQLNVSYLENGVYMLFIADTKGGVSRFKFIKK